jgi:hypothetical protein
MPRPKPPTVTELFIPKAARFLRSPKNLTKVAVQALFDQLTEPSGARRVAQEVRISRGSGASRFVYSFLCFRMTSPVPFLVSTDLTEVRYGFVLLIERGGYLAVFNRAAKGLDDAVEKMSRPVERRSLTHLFADNARYQKFSTRRMTVSKEELRSASYEADNLETAFAPATAARSILQNIRMTTEEHGTVGVTPSTGRIRTNASKTYIDELAIFVDQTITGITASTSSSFLSAFPEPVELADLPDGVLPVGLLFDLGAVYERLHDPVYPHTLVAPDTLPAVDELLTALSPVLTFREDGEQWEVMDDSGTVFARMKRLKNSYSVRFTFSREYAIEDAEGGTEPFAQWMRRYSAFSVTFTSPEYFYSAGKLYRIAGFDQEVAQVRKFLHVHAPLDTASSEKGGPYATTATRFSPDSIFGVVERTLASEDRYLWCCDLGDEWADYIGVVNGRVTFYHCKHGTPTTGASDFQTVVGQASKNLSRVKFRRPEVEEKVRQAEQRGHWAATRIPLLARDVAGWRGLENDFSNAIADPNAIWRVALVLTALSLRQFDEAAARPTPAPHFVQLIWLLSAFISNCRERDAQAVVYCRS